MNLFIHTINKPSESQRVQCDRDRIRTYDRLLRRQMLYPAELRDQLEYAKVINYIFFAIDFTSYVKNSNYQISNKLIIHELIIQDNL